MLPLFFLGGAVGRLGLDDSNTDLAIRTLSCTGNCACHSEEGLKKTDYIIRSDERWSSQKVQGRIVALQYIFRPGRKAIPSKLQVFCP